MSSIPYFLFLLLVPINLSNGSGIEPSVETVVIETTTEYREIITDIPEMDIQEAMNLDDGVYTTMVYRYINAQYTMKKEERCYDDYIKCLTSQGIQMPVCAFNNMKNKQGRDYSFKSYCQVYFDNCLRGYILIILDHINKALERDARIPLCHAKCTVIEEHCLEKQARWWLVPLEPRA